MTSSTNYGEEYHNGSIISAVVCQNGKSLQTDAKKESKFNSRLKNFYKNINQTLLTSNKIIKNGKKDLDFNKEDAKLNNHQQTKTFNINEFNPNDVDVKFEKDIPIDKLKLFKASVTSLKKSNIEHEQENNNRVENAYVTNPTAGCVKYDLKEYDSIISKGDKQGLQIYEVNFDNNFAYITPKLHLIEPPPLPIVANAKSADDTEIYQSINELDEEHESDDRNELIENLAKSQPGQQNKFDETNQSLNETCDSTTKIMLKDSENDYNQSMIYATPTNKRVLNVTNDNDTSMQNQNSSIIRLLNDNDETQA